MIKQHTAQSLAKYLGNKIKTDRDFEKIHNVPYYILDGVYLDGYLKLANPSHKQKHKCPIYDEDGYLIDCPDRYPANGSIYPEQCYPILKTYDRLLDINPETGNTFCEDIYKFESTKNFKVEIEYDGIYTENGERIINHEFEEIDLYLDKGFLNPFQLLEKLIQYGFGAIENKESPTGYVDLFGYPCVKDERE